MVEKIPHSRRYGLVGKGYSIGVAFLKRFEKIYAPLTAGLLAPFGGDGFLAGAKRCELDRLYQRISDDLDALLRAIGVPTSSPRNHANENKVLVGTPIAATKALADEYNNLENDAVRVNVFQPGTN